jgi:hypothetical protein
MSAKKKMQALREKRGGRHWQADKIAHRAWSSSAPNPKQAVLRHFITNKFQQAKLFGVGDAYRKAVTWVDLQKLLRRLSTTGLTVADSPVLCVCSGHSHDGDAETIACPVNHYLPPGVVFPSRFKNPTTKDAKPEG